jgi:hypothetical protein
MKHRNARGRIAYYHLKDGQRIQYGREWFSMTLHEDGQRILRAQCEIEPGVVAPRSVLREVTYTMNERYWPIECYNRLHSNGEFLGSGWMHFTETSAECQIFSPRYGRMTQHVPLKEPARSLGSHPLAADALHCPRFDHNNPERIQFQPDLWMTSLEHDGCSGPLLETLPLRLEYVGRESVTVQAGTFEADHYRFHVSVATGAEPRNHPAEDIWCLPDGCVFIKATVGGYMASEFELVEFEPWHTEGPA